MSASKYKIVFSGRVKEGQDPVKVKQNLMILFKLSDAAADKLFSGARVVIKKDLDEQEAKKYQLAFGKAGAICAIESGSSLAAADNTPENVVAGDTNADLAGATIAEAGSVLMEYQQPDAPDIDISTLSMGEAGEVIMKHPVVEPPSIDTGNLDVEPVGMDLDSTPQPAAVNIETGHLSTAPVGEVLSDAREIKKPEIDISGLSLEK